MHCRIEEKTNWVNPKLHELCALKLDWMTHSRFLPGQVGRHHGDHSGIKTGYLWAVIPPDAANTSIHLLVFTDASQNLGIVAIFGLVLRKCGKFSCQLLIGRSNLLTGLTIPKAEMKAAVAGATSASVVKRNLGEKFTGQIFATDSTVVLYWISQESKPLQVGVRNAVAEVWRFSTIQEWRQVSTNSNVANIGTRPAAVAEILPGCA
jgi:hypothetical protein